MVSSYLQGLEMLTCSYLICEMYTFTVKEDHTQANGIVPASPAPVEMHKEPVSPCIPGNPLKLPDGVGRGVYFSKITVPECGFLEVSVTHIIDPHHFWVMLIENWPALRALTEEMK